MISGVVGYARNFLFEVYPPVIEILNQTLPLPPSRFWYHSHQRCVKNPQKARFSCLLYIQTVVRTVNPIYSNVFA